MTYNYQLEEFVKEVNELESFELRVERALKSLSDVITGFNDRLSHLEGKQKDSSDVTQLQADVVAINQCIVGLTIAQESNTSRLDGCNWCGQGNLGAPEHPLDPAF